MTIFLRKFDKINSFYVTCTYSCYRPEKLFPEVILTTTAKLVQLASHPPSLSGDVVLSPARGVGGIQGYGQPMKYEPSWTNILSTTPSSYTILAKKKRKEVILTIKVLKLNVKIFMREKV